MGFVVSIFGFSGTLRRLPFLLYGSLAFLITVTVKLLITHTAQRFASEASLNLEGQIFFPFMAVILVVMPLRVWMGAALTVKRLRDIGLDPHHACWMVGAGFVTTLLTYIGVFVDAPVLSGAMWLCTATSIGSTGYLLLKPGKVGSPKVSVPKPRPVRPEERHPAYAHEAQPRKRYPF